MKISFKILFAAFLFIRTFSFGAPNIYDLTFLLENNDYFKRLTPENIEYLEKNDTPFSRAVLARNLVTCYHLNNNNNIFDIKNTFKGIKLLEVEAPNNPLAAFFLGELYLLGNGSTLYDSFYRYNNNPETGLPLDYDALAAEKYLLLATKGDPVIAAKAYEYLAKIKLNKDVELSEADILKAIEYLNLALQFGSGNSKNTLLEIYNYGVRAGYDKIIFPADRKKALELFKKYEKNSKLVYYSTPSITVSRLEKDISELIKEFENSDKPEYLHIAANAYMSRDNFFLSAFIEQGQVETAKESQDKKNALELYKKAANLDYAPSAEIILKDFRESISNEDFSRYLSMIHISRRALVLRNFHYNANAYHSNKRSIGSLEVKPEQKKRPAPGLLSELIASYNQSDVNNDDVFQKIIRKTSDTNYIASRASGRYENSRSQKEKAQMLEILQTLSDEKAPSLDAQISLVKIYLTEGKNDELKALLASIAKDNVLLDSALYELRIFLEESRESYANKDIVMEFIYKYSPAKTWSDFSKRMNAEALKKALETNDSRSIETMAGMGDIAAKFEFAKFLIQSSSPEQSQKGVSIFKELSRMDGENDCDADDPLLRFKTNSCAMLVYCYANGVGTDKNANMAVEQFKKTLSFCGSDYSTYAIINSFFNAEKALPANLPHKPPLTITDTEVLNELLKIMDGFIFGKREKICKSWRVGDQTETLIEILKIYGEFSEPPSMKYEEFVNRYGKLYPKLYIPLVNYYAETSSYQKLSLVSEKLFPTNDIGSPKDYRLINYANLYVYGMGVEANMQKALEILSKSETRYGVILYLYYKHKLKLIDDSMLQERLRQYCEAASIHYRIDLGEYAFAQAAQGFILGLRGCPIDKDFAMRLLELAKTFDNQFAIKALEDSSYVVEDKSERATERLPEKFWLKIPKSQEKD